MMTLKKGYFWLVVPLVVGIAIHGCAQSKGKEIGGSETNWLKMCVTQNDCSDINACECGICTKACRSVRDCSEVHGAASCLSTESLDNGSCRVAWKGETNEGICVARCESDSDCGDKSSFVCKNGICVAIIENPLGDETHGINYGLVFPSEDAEVSDPLDAEQVADANSQEFGIYQDPGQSEWDKGTTEYCKMDPALFDDSAFNNYAVFRYGKLCHMKGGDTVDQTYLSTMALGGVMVGRAAYLARNIERTGPGTGPILHTDLGTDWIAEPTYANREATINHIMAMVAHASPNLEDDELLFSFDLIGQDAINGLIEAMEKCIQQVPGLPRDAVTFVQQEIFDRMGMSDSSWDPWIVVEDLSPELAITTNPLGGLVIGWKASISDMGKLGTLLLHDGWYGGERLLSREWVYRMSHPAFEGANTAYGQLTWVNHRGNATMTILNDVTTVLLFDLGNGELCSPAAFWPQYPHYPSTAKDCMATTPGASCIQKYDVGVYSTSGLPGVTMVMHPGLDMVIVTHDYNSGSKTLWDAIRPGLLALDPIYKGDETTFCRDYGAGNYAPDLVNPRWKP